MPKRLTSLQLQHFSQVSPKQVADLRANPAALADFLKSPDVYRNGLGIYWHAVAFLLTGLAQNQQEPYSFFMKGGEIIGKNDAGSVRYLSPAQVVSLAGALKDEPPEELGLGEFDEARMDENKIYPERWVRSSDADHLGAMRELYSYVRAMIVSARKDKAGMIIHFERVPYEDSEPERPKSQSTQTTLAVAKPVPAGQIFFTGEAGRVYRKAEAAKHQSGPPDVLDGIDAVMARTGMYPVGDMITPDSPTDVLRGYLSDDATVLAILYLSDYGVGGYRFYSKLDDALVVASDAFVLEMKKFGFFADFLQNAEPAKLHEAVLARRKKLEKKHGKPKVFAPSLASVAAAWEEQHARCAGKR